MHILKYMAIALLKKSGRLIFDKILPLLERQIPAIPLSVLCNGVDPVALPEWRVRLRTAMMRLWQTHRAPRRYLRKKYPLHVFFAGLDRRGVRYVVLRWFEELPLIPPDEDLDLLVHDEDLPLLDDFLAPYHIRGATPLDVYSSGGVPGTNYRNALLYFPPKLGERILKNRVRWRNFCYVPAPEDHFLSLAYHAVYHKGAASGLPPDFLSRAVGGISGKKRSEGKNFSLPEHDYFTVLQNLAKKLQLPASVSVSLRGLHEYLEKRGMAPGVDVLRKLLPDRHPAVAKQSASGAVHKCVFLIREWAVCHQLEGLILRTLERHGFEIVEIIRLNAEQRQRAARRLRGGNWQRGPYPVSGGLPQMLVVTLDQHPQPPDAKLAASQPFLTNARVHFTKKVLRDYLNLRLPVRAQTNFLHSSDDDEEFVAYLTAVCPQRVRKIEEKMDQKIAAYRPTGKRLRDLSTEKRRAKVELVEWYSPNGTGRAVKKTFKSGRDRFLKREILAYRDLSKQCSLIPPLLESGHNFILLPDLQPLTDPVTRKKLLRKHLPEIARFLQFLYDNGLAHLDFKPANLLFTPEERLYIVDFEYLQPYAQRPAQLKQSYDLAGAPADFWGDLPVGGHRFIDRQWRQVLGMSLRRALRPWLP